MKVIQINAYYKYGSTGRLVADLHKHMLKNKIDSYVIYGKEMPINKNDEKEENIILMNNKFGFLIHKFLYHIFGNALSYSTFRTKKILKKIVEIKPDIIHLHNLHDYFINIELLFNYVKENNIKVVWTFHDCWAFTGHCTYFNNINCLKWKTECKKCPLQRKGPRSLIFDRSMEFYYKKSQLFNYSNLNIITVSQWLEKLTNESFLKNIKAKTIYNWIDQTKFYRANKKEINFMKEKYKLNGKKILLGLAPAWTERKGISDFIELSHKIGNDKIIFLVGNNPKSKLFGEKHISDIPSNIIMIDAISDVNELRIIYSMADVFLNLSRQETFGLTTAEALACGTPAIVYNLTACPEVVGLDKLSGLCIPYDNERIDNLIIAIEKILKINDSIQKNCINRVSTKFNKEKILNEYIDFYKNILN